MTKIIFLLLLFIFSTLSSISQDYVYKHYTRENGLAGNIVYCSSQDNDGFVWFGTENGVSRFDGKNFVSFTTDDGLTDNEVLHIFSDSKGRIWFNCFTAPLCYYYKGKIYSPTNTVGLNSDFKQERVHSMFEDRYGIIWFVGYNIFCFTNDSKYLLKIPFEKNLKAIQYKKGYKSALVRNYGINAAGHFFCYNKQDELIEFLANTTERRLTAEKIIFQDETKDYRCEDNNSDGTNYIISATQIIQTKIINDSLRLVARKNFEFQLNYLGRISIMGGNFWVPTTNGIKIISKDFLSVDTSLSGYSITSTFVDKNNNMWCTSRGDGVLFLNSSRIRYFNNADENNKNISAFNFDKQGNVLVESRLNYITAYPSNGKPAKYSFEILKEINDPVKKILLLENNSKLIATNYCIQVFDSNNQEVLRLQYAALKDVEEISQGKYLIATSNGCYIIEDTIKNTRNYYERFTTVATGEKNKHWAASIDTLYKVINDRLFADMRYDMKIEGRIIDMIYSSEKILWIATYNKGLKAIKDDKIYEFNFSRGMLSNQCRSLFFESPGNIWVITDKGINKIFYNIHDLSIISIKSITTADGLPSDLIRQVIKRNDTVWVATSNGLVFFEEKRINSITDIPVYLTKWEANNVPISKTSLTHDQNKISFEFTAISYSSGENIRFKYMLKGLDKAWVVTGQRRIEYGSLKPGTYKFLVKAIDKNGVESRQPVNFTFTILPAFWDTWWFRLLMIFVLSSILFLFFRHRLRVIKRTQIEKSEVDKKFAELKLEALRSQMNPHFIFNCLNAIQHFNIRDDRNSAQHFMAEFAKLIRKTLNHSRQDFVVLADEIELLETYIKLEKLRFEDLFKFNIDISQEVKRQSGNLLIPSLIFQPYVENAINHGLKYRKDLNGILNLQFSLQNNRLKMKLEDNGIGIQASEKLKIKENNKHESYGMSLNDSRIQVINRIHDLDITISITDKSVVSSTKQGTVVEISLPAKFNS